MKKRSQIAEKYKWNLDDIYPNFEALNEDIKKMSTYPEILSNYKGKLKKEKCFGFPKPFLYTIFYNQLFTFFVSFPTCVFFLFFFFFVK